MPAPDIPAASEKGEEPRFLMTMERNIRIYPWFKFTQSLLFWQAVWFLYFQDVLSPAAAIALYAVYDVSVTVLEVPLGVLSDRMGRKKTLIAAALSGAAGSVLLASGYTFVSFALGLAFIGAGAAVASGTDSATLYETLSALGRADEVEAQETRALQYSLWGFALSAVVGGGVALWSYEATFWGAATALLAGFVLATQLTEPPQSKAGTASGGQIAALWDALTQPVLRWIFLLAVAMYGFSLLPFVFGQPFIAASLDEIGFGAETPVVSGIVTAVMMGLSVFASLYALRLRGILGLTGILLLAFSMQILLVLVLALTQSWLAIAVLFLRIVPDAFSHPFKMGRIHPLLRDEVRATYVSLQSLAGKLVFALSLFVAAGATSDVTTLPYADIRQILGWYITAGAVLWVGLWLTATRAGVEPDQ